MYINYRALHLIPMHSRMTASILFFAHTELEHFATFLAYFHLILSFTLMVSDLSLPFLFWIFQSLSHLLLATQQSITNLKTHMYFMAIPSHIVHCKDSILFFHRLCPCRVGLEGITSTWVPQECPFAPINPLERTTLDQNDTGPHNHKYLRPCMCSTIFLASYNYLFFISLT